MSRVLGARGLLLLLPAFVLMATIRSAPTGAEVPTSTDAMSHGLALLRSGDLAAAEAVFRQLVEEDPDHGPARFQLGRIALGRGELGEAQRHLEVATSADLRRPLMAWHLLGQVQLLQGQLDDATRSFGHALDRAPLFAPALIGRARAALRRGDVQIALTDLESIQSFDQPPPEASLLLAEVLILEERAGEAEAVLSLLAEAQGSEVAWEAQMLLWTLRGAPPNGPSLRVALGENLHNARGLLALALLELRSENRAAATFPLLMAMETDDQDPVAWLLLQRSLAPARPTPYPAPAPRLAEKLAEAKRQLESGNRVEARQIASRILATRPFHAKAHFLVISTAEINGELWEALAEYRLLLEWLPRVPALEARAARVARSMNAFELAECLVRSALRTSPDDFTLHHLLGAIQADLGAHDAAIDSCTQAVALGARDASLYQTLGRAHFERMEIGEAVAAYRKALEIDPETARALPPFALSSLNTPDLGALGGLLEACLEVHPEDANALYGLGLVRLREKDLDRARGLFEKLSTLTPDDSRIPYNLGLIHFREGDRVRGEVAMERFSELKEVEDQVWLMRNRAHAMRLDAQDASLAGNAKEALRIYEEMASAGTAKFEDYLEAGRLSQQLGDYRRSYGWFEGLLEAEPYRRDALEGLLAAADALVRKEVARQSRERLSLLSSPCQTARGLETPTITADSE